MTELVAEAPVSEKVDSSLPYANEVPGAVVGRWAESSEPALVVAPDKLIPLLTHLRDREGYDFLSSVTCVDYSAYNGKARTGVKERFDTVYHLYNTKKGGGSINLHVRVPEDGSFCHRRLSRCKFTRVRSLRFVRHQVCWAPKSTPRLALGRLQWPPHAQGLERGLF